MSGGGGNTSSTVTNTNIPEYARPYVESMLGAALKESFNVQQSGTGEDAVYDITGTKPYNPYSIDPREYVAGFSPLQQSSFLGAQQLQVPGQIGLGSDITAATAASSADVGQQGLGYGALGAQTGFDYFNQASDPTRIAQFMNPYMQNVVEQQMAGARRQADITEEARNAQLAKAGAFGGSRQAIEQAEANRALNTQLAGIQAQGLQSAYDKALEQLRVGTQYGLQGAGVGLQGIQSGLAGLGQAGQLGGQLGQLGMQQQQAETGILGLQQQLGATQQQQEQNIINQAIQNYATAQQYPQQQLSFLNAMIRGMATPTTTTQSYQAAPSLTSQLAGLGTAGIAGLGLYNATK